MDTGLGWLGAVVGLAGCIATFFLSGSPPGGNGGVRRTAGLTFILTIVFWAIAMQRGAPFSTGQTLGWGFLIGGLTGTAAILLSSRLGSAEGPRPMAVHSILFLALFGASLTYLIFNGYPQPAMIGFAIGSVMAGILAYYSIEESADLIQSWALFGVALSAGVVLAVEHFNQLENRYFWPLPILLGTIILIASFTAVELSQIGRLRRASALISAIGAPILVIILCWRLTGLFDWQLLAVAAVGIAIAGLVRWLDSQKANPAVSALLVIAFLVAAFKLWAGLGIALGLLAMWSVVSENKKSMQVISLGLAFLLVKLFTEKYSSALRATDLQVHYSLIGAALGIVIPFLLGSSLKERRSIAVIALIGLAMAISPIVLYLVWETKAVFGYLFGLSAAMILQMLVNEERRSIGLLVIGAELTTIQFMSSLLLLELARTQRVWILGIVIVAGAIALIFVPRRAIAESSSAEATADKGE